MPPVRGRLEDVRGRLEDAEFFLPRGVHFAGLCLKPVMDQRQRGLRRRGGSRAGGRREGG